MRVPNIKLGMELVFGQTQYWAGKRNMIDYSTL